MSRDREKVSITIFTDPMMGLSYEMEPVMERLRGQYREQVEFHYCMGLLVPDIHRFMTAEELALPQEEGFAQYNRRLAGIYQREEEIGGVPIHMEGFHLFDAQHTTTRPLCLAVKAAQIIAPDRAEEFLHRLRRATCAEGRQTTSWAVIEEIAGESGIGRKPLRECVADGQADAALERDLALGAALGIYSLPAYLIRCREKALILQSFSYADFVRAIQRVSDGQVTGRGEQS